MTQSILRELKSHIDLIMQNEVFPLTEIQYTMNRLLSELRIRSDKPGVGELRYAIVQCYLSTCISSICRIAEPLPREGRKDRYPTMSLPRIIEIIIDNSDSFEDTSKQDLNNDLSEIYKKTKKIMKLRHKAVSHYDADKHKLIGTNGTLTVKEANELIDFVSSLVQKYYRLIFGAQMMLPTDMSDEWIEIFQSPT